MTAGKKNLLGILMDPLEREIATAVIVEAARQRRPLAASAMAVHGIMTGVLEPAHRYRLNDMDLLVADGQPVRWALNRIHNVGLKNRVYGPSLVVSVLADAEREGIPVYFYGCTPEILEALKRELKKRFPRLQIAGMEPSTFGFLRRDDADEIARRICESGARLVFVGIGCPRQEVWAYEFRHRLQMPIVAVGAAFPILGGKLQQAPKWMQDRGLEWLFRLSKEPGRLWQRYLLLSPMYLFLVGCQWLGMRFSAAGREPAQELLYG